MRSKARSTSVRRLPVVEGLEGRMLLSSAWVGTWNVELSMMSFELEGANGLMEVKNGKRETAVITETGPGQFHLTADQGGFQMNLTGTEDWLQGGWSGQPNSEGYHSDMVFRMRRFEGNVVSVFSSMVEYNAANQRKLTYAEMDGGFAWKAGTSLSLSSFPWEGTFRARTTNMDAGPSSPSPFDSTVGDEARTVEIEAVEGKSNTYTVEVSGDDDVHEWTLQGNKLVYAYEGVSEGGSAYKHQFDTLVQGPGGRLFYFGAGAEFNPMAGFIENGRTYGVGQMKNAWLGSGYTNTFKAAPVLKTVPMHLTAIREDERTNTGTPISSLIASSGINTITDLNKGAKEGIALTAVNASYGRWQYTTNGGTTWTNVGVVSEISALLLGSDAQNLSRLRLIPARDYNGTIADAVTFRAWDQTAGSNGAKVSVSINGGFTAYSSALAQASIRVKPVNDAPVLSAPATIRFTGAVMNKNFNISFDTLRIAMLKAGLTYSDVDTDSASLGFRVTALSGSLKQNGTAAANPLELMPTESFAWRPAANATGRITALRVQIWDDGAGLASNAFVTVLINVATGVGMAG